MNEQFVIRMYGVIAAAVVVLMASPAAAQFQAQPTGEPVIGERFWIEGSAGFWNPSADMAISSESLGIPGDDIDFKRDLGLNDERFSELHLVLKPGRKHKFRFQYIPIKYEQSATITRNIVFNGQLYRIGVPVNSVLDWKAYRFGYEYDFISSDWGFAGLILEAKYTDVRAELASPIISEFAHAAAPIPAIGGIARVYVTPNISITGEFSGLKIPNSIDESFEAHYTDLDVYGTFNFTSNIGAQLGFRALDVGYLVDEDTGSFAVKGLYFGVVARY
jgi:hypothetical protein